jgi:hypothetical protein
VAAAFRRAAADGPVTGGGLRASLFPSPQAMRPAHSIDGSAKRTRHAVGVKEKLFLGIAWYGTESPRSAPRLCSLSQYSVWAK